MTLVLFGETHGLLNEIPKVEELIQIHSPQLILYEMLEETQLLTPAAQESFLTNNPEENFSLISKYKDLFDTVKLARKYNIPIMGCDYKNMLRKNTNFRKLAPTKENLSKDEVILIKREHKQLATIKEHMNKNLLVLVGVYHLRKHSLLRSLKSTIITPRIDGKQLDEVDYLDGEVTYVEEHVGQSYLL